MNKANSCTRVAFYEEVGFAMLPKSDNPQKFLALYYTNQERLQDEDAFTSASPEDDLDIRNYKLIQDFNPKRLGEGKSDQQTSQSG